MTYMLAPQISFGFIGAGAVVLDLAADRYLRLGGAETEVLRALAGRKSAGAGALALDRLCRRGILIAGADPVVPVVAPAIASSAVETSSPVCASSPPGAMEVLTSRFVAARWMDAAGLSRTIACWRKRRKRADRLGKIPPSPLAELAGSFRQRLRYYPAKRRCVPDSLALMTCLWRRGYDADLYFGVRLDPFAAHCWVQAGDLLLSDPAASVAEFSPVFRL